MNYEDRFPKGAARIKKGAQKVMTISERDVVALLEPRALIDGLEEGFRAFSKGRVQSPDRPEISIPDTGFLLAMPAWRPGGPMMVKMVNVFDGNLARGLPNHLAVINLFDATTGRALCLMDGTHITGARTAGASAVSTRVLAREGAKVATIIGAGVQGREHLTMLPIVRDFEEILVHSLHHEDAEDLARDNPKARAVHDLEAAVRRSDVVCLCSHSVDPVIAPEWVSPGTHVTSVGYTPAPGELPRAIAENHALFVESAAAFDPQPVGCAELWGMSPGEATELGDVLAGVATGRTSADQVTVYKAMGIAMEDLVAATLVYDAALERGIGATIDL